MPRTEGIGGAGGGRQFDARVSPIMVNEDAPDLATDRVDEDEVIQRDEGPRADTSAEGLGENRVWFAAKGSVTAGNSSQMSDGGGGASILVSEKVLRGTRPDPLARWIGYAVAGVRLPRSWAWARSR